MAGPSTASAPVDDLGADDGIAADLTQVGVVSVQQRRICAAIPIQIRHCCTDTS